MNSQNGSPMNGHLLCGTHPEREVLARLERQLDSGGSLTLILQSVPGNHVQMTETWGLRLSQPEPEQVLLETRDLRYTGDDVRRQRLFSPARCGADGFSPIALIRRKDPERLMAMVWEILGWHHELLSTPDDPEAGPGETEAPPAGTRQPRTEEGTEPMIDRPDRSPATRDLVEQARAGRILAPLGREGEIDESIRILSKHSKSAAVLVGEAGVGKTAVAEGLACRIAEGQVPPSLVGAELLEVNLGLLAAGATRVNEFEGRLQQILDRARDNPSIILFLDELHLIRDARSDASQMMKADLGRGRIRCLAATTTGEFRVIEEDPALQRRFQKVPILEPSRELTLRILRDATARLENHHDVDVPDQVVGPAVDLARRFVRERRLPDSALDLVDEACAMASLRRSIGDSESQPTGTLTVEHLLDVVSTWTRVPVDQLGVLPADVKRLEALEALLNREVLGQEPAIGAVIRHLRRQALRPTALPEERQLRPRGAFLLHGPSGVGKSSLPQVLAPELCGEGSLIRIDCSTLDQEHSVARLVGAPPGYIGHGRGGELTNQLRSRAFGVLLFDEIEKAHPTFAEKILIPALGEGCITDMNTGQSLDLSGFLIFATTNLGAGPSDNRPLGFAVPERTSTREVAGMPEALRRFFSPPVLGRFDAILGFSPLSHVVSMEILEQHRAELEASLRERYPDLRLLLDRETSALLLEEIRTEIYEHGARGITGAFRSEVEDPVLEHLLEMDPDSSHPLQLSIRRSGGRSHVNGGSRSSPPAATAAGPHSPQADILDPTRPE